MNPPPKKNKREKKRLITLNECRYKVYQEKTKHKIDIHNNKKKDQLNNLAKKQIEKKKITPISEVDNIPISRRTSSAAAKLVPKRRRCYLYEGQLATDT